MGFRARLTTGKLTLLSRTGTTSRTTDSERISWAGVVLLHGRSGSIAPVSLNRRYAIAHRSGPCPQSLLGRVRAAFLRRFTLGQSLKTRLKMRTPFFKWWL